MFKKFINWFRRYTFYVICDPADNSITLSRALFRHMGVMKLDVAKVFVFHIPHSRDYGFTLNPQLGQLTQLADVQYNAKHRCIGFESLNPTVNRILYDYRLPHDRKVKLTVLPCKVIDVNYYKICRPHDQSSR